MHDEWTRPRRIAENFGFRTRWTADAVRSPFFFRTSRDFFLPFFSSPSLPTFSSLFRFFPFFFPLFLRLFEAVAKSGGIKRRMSPLFQVLPPWKAAKSGSISFKIRTNEANGLIMYSRSGAHARVCGFPLIYCFPRSSASSS